MTVQCPECGSEEFTLLRGGDMDPGGTDAFAVDCAECDNQTAVVVAQGLDERLQIDDEQEVLSGWSE